jgi:hypothetical protein
MLRETGTVVLAVFACSLAGVAPTAISAAAGGRRLYEQAEGETASSRVGHVSHRECRYQSEERKSSPHLKSIL